MELDLFTYRALIEKLIASGKTQFAEPIYLDRFVTNGVNPDPWLLGCMLICYCKLGRLEEEKLHFESVVRLGNCNGAYCGLIRELFVQSRVLDAFDYFVRINDAGILLGISCYNMLIAGLSFRGYLDEALSVFDIMLDRGIPPVTHLWKSLFFGFCRSGRLDEAEMLSLEMELSGVSLDKIMYTALINCYCKKKEMKMATRVFLKMLKVGCDPDTYTYDTLIHGFVNLGLFDKAWLLHDHMKESGVEPDLVTYQVMISKFCEGHKVDLAIMFLSRLYNSNLTPSVHCYTPIISALYKENRLMEVSDLYEKMVDTRVIPDHVLFFSLIKNYPKGQELDLTQRIFSTIAEYECGVNLESVSRNVEPEISHLLGKLVESRPDLANVAISIYIVGLCMGGKTDEALLSVADFVDLGFQPFVSAYNSLSNAFAMQDLLSMSIL